jgi:hypothetical protein
LALKYDLYEEDLKQHLLRFFVDLYKKGQKIPMFLYYNFTADNRREAFHSLESIKFPQSYYFQAVENPYYENKSRKRSQKREDILKHIHFYGIEEGKVLFQEYFKKERNVATRFALNNITKLLDKEQATVIWCEGRSYITFKYVVNQLKDNPQHIKEFIRFNGLRGSAFRDDLEIEELNVLESENSSGYVVNSKEKFVAYQQLMEEMSHTVYDENFEKLLLELIQGFNNNKLVHTSFFWFFLFDAFHLLNCSDIRGHRWSRETVLYGRRLLEEVGRPCYDFLIRGSVGSISSHNSSDFNLPLPSSSDIFYYFPVQEYFFATQVQEQEQLESLMGNAEQGSFNVLMIDAFDINPILSIIEAKGKMVGLRHQFTNEYLRHQKFWETIKIKRS